MWHGATPAGLLQTGVRVSAATGGGGGMGGTSRGRGWDMGMGVLVEERGWDNGTAGRGVKDKDRPGRVMGTVDRAKSGWKRGTGVWRQGIGGWGNWERRGVLGRWWARDRAGTGVFGDEDGTFLVFP